MFTKKYLYVVKSIIQLNLLRRTPYGELKTVRLREVSALYFRYFWDYKCQAAKVSTKKYTFSNLEQKTFSNLEQNEKKTTKLQSKLENNGQKIKIVK